MIIVTRNYERQYRHHPHEKMTEVDKDHMAIMVELNLWPKAQIAATFGVSNAVPFRIHKRRKVTDDASP